MECRDLPDDAQQVRRGPAADLRGVAEVGVLRLDDHRRVGVAAELGELLVQALDLVHVAEEVLARLALDHGHEPLVLDERVVADGQLPARDARARELPGVELGRVDHDVEPAAGEELDPPARAVGADALLGAEEDLLVGAGPVLEGLLDLQELAALPLGAVEGDRELAAEARQVRDGHPLVRLERLRRVELRLAQAEDLAARARPMALRAHGQERPALLLDRDAEGEPPVLRALDDPGGHGRGESSAVRVVPPPGQGPGGPGASAQDLVSVKQACTNRQINLTNRKGCSTFWEEGGANDPRPSPKATG